MIRRPPRRRVRKRVQPPSRAQLPARPNRAPSPGPPIPGRAATAKRGQIPRERPRAWIPRQREQIPAVTTPSASSIAIAKRSIIAASVRRSRPMKPRRIVSKTVSSASALQSASTFSSLRADRGCVRSTRRSTAVGRLCATPYRPNANLGLCPRSSMGAGVRVSRIAIVLIHRIATRPAGPNGPVSPHSRADTTGVCRFRVLVPARCRVRVLPPIGMRCVRARAGMEPSCCVKMAVRVERIPLRPFRTVPTGLARNHAKDQLAQGIERSRQLPRAIIPGHRRQTGPQALATEPQLALRAADDLDDDLVG